MLNYPVSQKELLLWQNIIELGGDPKIIEENTEIRHFLAVYDDITMFHYFTDNSNVVEIMFNKYKNKFMLGQLTKEEYSLPLLIFHRDMQGKTALDYARNEQRYKTFKIFIDFL